MAMRQFHPHFRGCEMLPSIYGDTSVAMRHFRPYMETLPAIYGNTSVAVRRFHP